jgi:cytidylate kinase
MNTPVGLEKCWTFINCNMQSPDSTRQRTLGWDRRAVTVSRQSGCGAHVICDKLAEHLQARFPADAPPWTVFDSNLVEQVLADHNLPGHLARFMREDRMSAIDDAMHQIFGLHPPAETLVAQTSETILRLAELGNVILLGRGSNVITARLPHVVHVRIVAPLEQRLEHMEHFEHLSRKEAADRIRREDLGRERYLRTHFNRNIDDPLLYHLVINTSLISLDDAARLIADVVLHQKPVPVVRG